MDKLQNNALIVKVECTKWSNTVEDRDISVEIVSDKNAEARSLKVMKPLAKGPVIKELNKLIGQVGNQVIRKWCVPWDTGKHLIVVDNLKKFEADLKAKNDRLEELKIELRAEWLNIVRDDQLKLGDAFKPSDYPNVEDIVDKYSIKYSLFPITSADDVPAQLRLPAERIRQIEADVEADANERVEAGMKAIHKRVTNVLNTFIDGMDRHGIKAQGQQRASKFSDTTVTAIEELAETLPHINLTNDPALTEVANDLLSRMRDLDPQKLRDDPAERKSAAETARDIASKLNGLFD